MIELAPQNKLGLALKRPLLPAAGFYGYHPLPYPNLIDNTHFGALVTNPITLRPHPHHRPPQAIEVNGGVLFTTPPRNPGVRRIISRYRRAWRRAAIPIIAHLPADVPDDLARTAGALDSLSLLAGFELGLPLETTTNDLLSWIDAIQSRSELPLLVKLSPSNWALLAETAVLAGVDALVVAAPPPGMVDDAAGILCHGDFYGPGILPQRLLPLQTLHQQFPDLPLIAGGGIHTSQDVRAYLRAGATAVQVDTLIFTDPLAVSRLIPPLEDRVDG